MTNDPTQTVINSTMYGGGATALFGVTISEWAAITGAVCAILGLAVNIWRSRRLVKNDEKKQR